MQPRLIALCAIVTGATAFSSFASGQQKTLVPASKRKVHIKVMDATTESYIQKHRDDFGPRGTRARVVSVQIQVPADLELAMSNPQQDSSGQVGEETFYILQDTHGNQFMDDGYQEFGISAANKNNIQTLSWTTKDTPIPRRSRRSLRFKMTLYFFKRHSKGQIRPLVDTSDLDTPVKYKS